MGLSRNKVAVSEGAAGSPPFYGDRGRFSRICRSRMTRVRSQYGVFCCSIFRDRKRSLKKERAHEDGGVAQLGEHLPCKQGVMGSIPIISTSRQCRHPMSIEDSEKRSFSPRWYCFKQSSREKAAGWTEGFSTMERTGKPNEKRSVAQVVRARA